MHNNIMAAGSRDRPPMLATGRYAQWRSRFLRYIDTRPNGDALRKCILTGPLLSNNGHNTVSPATENSPENSAKTSVRQLLKKDSDPEQAQEGQKFAEEFGSHCKNGHQMDSLEFMRALNVVGARETVVSVGKSGPGIHALTARNLVIMLGMQKALRSILDWLADRMSKLIKTRVGSTLQLHGKDSKEVPNADSRHRR
ncbi:hypothetical protein Tco_0140935 [Tanacetum coccineum]